MHGTGDSYHFQHIEPKFGQYIEKYEGYLSTHDCERADVRELSQLVEKIRSYTEQ